MFGDADIEDLDPENLEMSKVKDLRQAAAQAEEASISKEHSPISSDGITHVPVRSTPVPLEFGIPEISQKMLKSPPLQIQPRGSPDFTIAVGTVPRVPRIRRQ